MIVFDEQFNHLRGNVTPAFLTGIRGDDLFFPAEERRMSSSRNRPCSFENTKSQIFHAVFDGRISGIIVYVFSIVTSSDRFCIRVTNVNLKCLGDFCVTVIT